MHNTNWNTTSHGYVAIATVTVIAAALILITITTSLTSISEGQMALGGTLSAQAKSAVSGCAQEALLQLNLTNALPASITIPAGSCTVTTNSQSGSSWNFTVTGTFANYTKSVTIGVNRTSTISIVSWREDL